MVNGPSTPVDSRTAKLNLGITYKDNGTVYNRKSDLT